MDENNLVILGNSQILFRDVDGNEFISYTSKQSGWITQVRGKRLSSTLAKSKAWLSGGMIYFYGVFLFAVGIVHSFMMAIFTITLSVFIFFKTFDKILYKLRISMITGALIFWRQTL